MASGAGERTQFRASFGTNSGAWQSTPAQESRPVTLWAVLAKLPDYLCPQQFEALPRRDGTRWCPEDKAGVWSQLFFNYATPLIRVGYRKHLEVDDLWDVSQRDEAAVQAALFQESLEATREAGTSPRGTVWRAIVNTYGFLFSVAGVIKIVHDGAMFAAPFILQRLLAHLGAGGERSTAFGWAAAMLAAGVIETLTINVYFHILWRMCLHLKLSMIDMLYDKSLRITSTVKSTMGVGAIANLQSNDAAKLWNLPLYMHVLWNGPMQILVVMSMLVRIMGWLPAFAGLLSTVALIPISTVVGKYLAASRREQVKHTDARVKLTSEVVTGIKAIKLYAWEDAYMQRISQLRELELKQIRFTQSLSMFSTAVFMSGPVIVSLAAFAAYTATGRKLTADVAFPALVLFNLLRFPMAILPSQIMALIQARVSLTRIQKFLEADEMAGPPAAGSSSFTSNAAGGGGVSFIVNGGGGDGAAANGGGGASPQGFAVAPMSRNPFDAVPSPLQLAFSGASSKLFSPSLPAPGAASATVAISVHDASFAWDRTQPAPTLRSISLDVHRGALVMVVGKVGSGKSSLLAALLGEMHRTEGTAPVKVAGSVAFTAQDPWIQNTTLRNNVLMGSPLAEQRYIDVLHACALGPDLAMLPAADDSEIGEKGINLSGGQKHRVALARACYADADVYLLDDPLSAVDAHVGRHLFDKCVGGLLKGRTRVLVTHQLQYLPSCDLVVVMHEGSIAQVGTYQALVDRGVDFHQFVKVEKDAEKDGGDQSSKSKKTAVADAAGQQQAAPPGSCATQNDHAGVDANAITPAAKRQQQQDVADVVVDYVVDEEARAAARKSLDSKEALAAALRARRASPNENSRITKVEERAVGSVDKAHYKTYLSAWGALYLIPLAIVCSSMGERGLQVAQNYVLSRWTNATAREIASGEPLGTNFLSIYFAFGLSSIVMQVARSYLLINGSISASRLLHGALLGKVVRLPMSFFDSQPSGRLLNRFTKDTEALDVNLASTWNSFLSCAVTVLFALVVVIGVSPVVVVGIVPLGLLYYYIQEWYVASSRELKRLDSVSNSPIFQLFSETLHGLQTIRAFRKQPLFLERNRGNLDHNSRAWWPIQVVNRWLSVRLELIGTSVVFFAALFAAVVMPRNAGLAGLALTSALNLTNIMNWMVRQTTELEVNMNSVERLVEYNRNEEEAPAVVDDARPPPGWPSTGVIVATDVVVRYRPELDPVLKGVSFYVRGCEKVGVCGRTGCGKSTLMMALYRIVELSGGSVVIDGVDVARIGLRDLRSKLSLVPQDPVIFSGTVRSNLDPFSEAASDGVMWQALQQAGIDGFVRSLPSGLDSSIKEGGVNMSVGQRQLLCMARALLRASRILVLDEATSNVDNASDALIQATVRSAFRDCTVLTIAHRLHTIIDSDRVMLLEGGLLREMDTPRRLLSQPGSAFRGLVDETTRGGGVGADVITAYLNSAPSAADLEPPPFVPPPLVALVRTPPPSQALSLQPMQPKALPMQSMPLQPVLPPPLQALPPPNPPQGSQLMPAPPAGGFAPLQPPGSVGNGGFAPALPFSAGIAPLPPASGFMPPQQAFATAAPAAMPHGAAAAPQQGYIPQQGYMPQQSYVPQQSYGMIAPPLTGQAPAPVVSMAGPMPVQSSPAAVVPQAGLMQPAGYSQIQAGQMAMPNAVFMQQQLQQQYQQQQRQLQQQYQQQLQQLQQQQQYQQQPHAMQPMQAVAGPVHWPVPQTHFFVPVAAQQIQQAYVAVAPHPAALQAYAPAPPPAPPSAYPASHVPVHQAPSPLLPAAAQSAPLGQTPDAGGPQGLAPGRLMDDALQSAAASADSTAPAADGAVTPTKARGPDVRTSLTGDSPVHLASLSPNGNSTSQPPASGLRNIGAFQRFTQQLSADSPPRPSSLSGEAAPPSPTPPTAGPPR